jgi:hypothetical protein
MQTSAPNDFWPFAWRTAIAQAEAGDGDLLRQLLLDAHPENIIIPDFARVWLWDVMSGAAKLKLSRPGNKSRVKDKASAIRYWFEELTSAANDRGPGGKPVKKGDAIAALAKMHNVSEATIKDVLAKRKTFVAE